MIVSAIILKDFVLVIVNYENVSYLKIENKMMEFSTAYYHSSGQHQNCCQGVMSEVLIMRV